MCVHEIAVPKGSAAKGRTQNDGKGRDMTVYEGKEKEYATSRKIAGSIPDVVTGIFHRNNPTGRTMVLRSTRRPLTEMNTRNISWKVKAAVV
jgi:hypothetical protein